MTRITTVRCAWTLCAALLAAHAMQVSAQEKGAKAAPTVKSGTFQPLVSVEGRDIALTKKEFSLLLVLASDPTRVFAKQELVAEVWGQGGGERTRTLDSHASRLRRKLDPQGCRYVINCWGVGFRLCESAEPGAPGAGNRA